MNESLVCKYCNTNFHRQSKHKHMRSCKQKPEDSVKLSCTVCKKQFTRKDSLLKHKRGRCKDLTSIYKCETCDKEFDRPANLKRHMAIHDKQHYKCNGCLKEYKRLDYFNKHICHRRRSKRNKLSFAESLDHSVDIDIESYDCSCPMMMIMMICAIWQIY